MLNTRVYKRTFRIGGKMRVGRLVPLMLFLVVVYHSVAPITVNAASAIFYIPSDYDGTAAAPLVTNTADFTPICNGSGGNPRLPGLNLARAFAGGQMCPGTTESNQFTTEPLFVFLIDDTSPLSTYITRYYQSQNLLQQVGGRSVIAPGLRTFQLGSQTVTFMFVGEMAYRQGGSNPANWFTTLNSSTGTSFVARTKSPYMTQCEAANVPLPPDWKNDRAQNTALGWQYRGNLPRNLVLASTEPVTEVWAHSDPKGVCMALPRKNAAGDIKLLGIICQSKQSGKSCFWDNVQNTGPNAGNRLEGAATNNMKISEIEGGPQLNENCTNCHRGQNVFLVPNDGPPLSLEASSSPTLPEMDNEPTVRYQPLSGTPPRPNWQNPPPFAQESAVGCSRGCHEIPALTTNYCQTVLKGVFDRNLMPPGGGWQANPSMGSAIITACRALGVNITPAP